MDPVNLADFEAIAKEKLGQSAFDYYASGADDEVALTRNREAFQRIEVLYRVLVDVSRRDASTALLGETIRAPILIAPTAFHRLAHADGELATARAAEAAGTIMILSSLSNTAVEEVVRATAAPVWFQLYVYRDRGATEAVVRRAEAAGCRALVLTVDAPLLGRRERDVKNRFHLPEGLAVENLVPSGYGGVERPADDSGLATYFASLIDASLTWKDLAWLASITELPIFVKGIVRPDDALRAVEHGAAGIVVSNHGGRQLDASPATVDVLPEVVEAVDARLPILIDGGVRRGTDVLKAVALGADAVLVGRPILWALAADGQRGVEGILAMLQEELDLAMALAGCPSIAEITRDLIR